MYLCLLHLGAGQQCANMTLGAWVQFVTKQRHERWRRLKVLRLGFAATAFGLNTSVRNDCGRSFQVPPENVYG